MTVLYNLQDSSIPFIILKRSLFGYLICISAFLNLPTHGSLQGGQTRRFCPPPPQVVSALDKVSWTSLIWSWYQHHHVLSKVTTVVKMTKWNLGFIFDAILLDLWCNLIRFQRYVNKVRKESLIMKIFLKWDHFCHQRTGLDAWSRLDSI